LGLFVCACPRPCMHAVMCMCTVKSVLVETQTPPLFLAQQSREGKKKKIILQCWSLTNLAPNTVGAALFPGIFVKK